MTEKVKLKVIIKTMDNFFPDAEYKIPETSNYMKFVEGDNKFRVLSSAIVGYEYFNKDMKPVRSRTPFDETPDIKKDGRVNHFWAFVVWNYKAERIQILELTQKGIMKFIQALVKNPKWGNPKGYDITVTRQGSGLDTEYTFVADPHSEIAESIALAYEKKVIDLEALYEGKDPFIK